MRQFNLKEEFIGKPLEEIEENFHYHSIIDNIKVVISTGKILEKEIQTTDLRWYQMNICRTSFVEKIKPIESSSLLLTLLPVFVI
jgi:hypothetical protein